MSTAQATTAAGAGLAVSLAEAARRTGLADSAAAMADYCGRREVAVGGPAAYPVVNLRAFGGAPVAVEIGEVTVLESGVL